MIVAIVILVCIAAALPLSAKYKNKISKNKIFDPMALWIIEVFHRHGIELCSEKNARSIRSSNLLGGTDTNLLYTVRKLSQSIAVLAAGCVLTIAYCVSRQGGGSLVRLIRPDYGMDAEEVQLYINGIEEDFSIQPVLYDIDTITENFECAYQELLTDILGENEDLEHIRTDLKLPSYLEQYAMNVTWYSGNETVLGSDGSVQNRYFSENQTENVTLTVTLSCQDVSCIYEIDITVMAPDLSEKERLVRNIAAQIQKNNTDNRLEQEIALPADMEGESVSYMIKEERFEWVFLIGTFIAGLAVFFGRDSDLRKLDKNKQNQMLIDYPEIISKLTILMGAGMSVRRAWEKIVEDYTKKNVKRYAYEEMVITCNQIRAGAMEGIAYSDFGKRCNIHEYLKLGAVLEQNVKSGTKGLTAILEAEAWLAFEVRKNTAVKMGEEAGTRLLLPMLMMLAVVLVIVMVPALMSLGI